MGARIVTPTIRSRKLKTNQPQSFQETNILDALSPEFLEDATKELVEHALLDADSINSLMRQKFELFFSCLRLPKMDAFSKTDACIYCFLVSENEAELIHKTEVIADEQDPLFAKPLQLTFNSSELQKDVIMNVFDIDKYNPFGEHEKQYIGTVSATIQQLTQNVGFQSALRYDEKQSGEAVKKETTQQTKRNLKATSNYIRGELKVKAYNSEECSDKYIFQIEGINIHSKESVYLRVVTSKMKKSLSGDLSKISKDERNFEEDTKDIPLFQTDLNKSQKIIQWPAFHLPEKKIFQSLKFEVYEFFETRVKKELIGEFKVAKEAIKSLHGTEQHIRMQGKNHIQGTLRFSRITKMMHPFSLLHYIYGGLNMQFILAFDFSSLQKNPCASDSESELARRQLQNQYESAINSCIDLVRFYQSNQMVPMYGIGARLPPSFSHHSNIFALSGDWYDPEVDISNKANAAAVYKNTHRKVKPSSSLVFSEVLKFANNYCAQEQFDAENQSLCMLLIFSHNELLHSDIEETVGQLKKDVHVPFQTINIGIGNGSFEYISKLQSDENYEIGKKFNFIQYEQYKSNEAGFCSAIFKTIPKLFLERVRREIIPPIRTYSTIKEARSEYLNSLTIGQKKNFECLNERPFFEYLTKDLGLKVDIIKSIFGNGLEEEEVGLVMDRIGEYSKNKHQFYFSNEGLKNYGKNVPQMMLQKVKQFYRTKEKFNAHTKKQEDKTLAIKKQSQENSSPFSFFYKAESKIPSGTLPVIITPNKDKIENSNKWAIPDGFNLNEELLGIRSHIKSEHKGFASPPKKREHFSAVSQSSEKKTMRHNNFLRKLQDAAASSSVPEDQQADDNISINRQSQNGFNCQYCDGKKIQIIMMPCGHNCCCQQYFDSIEGSICPTCHSPVVQIVKFIEENNSEEDLNISTILNIRNKKSQSVDKETIPIETKDKKQTEPVIQLFVDKSELFSSIQQKRKDRPRQENNLTFIAKKQ